MPSRLVDRSPRGITTASTSRTVIDPICTIAIRIGATRTVPFAVFQTRVKSDAATWIPIRAASSSENAQALAPVSTIIGSERPSSRALTKKWPLRPAWRATPAAARPARSGSGGGATASATGAARMPSRTFRMAVTPRKPSMQINRIVRTQIRP